MQKPTVLLILDGFGYRTNNAYNAIAHAKAPTLKRLWSSYPHTLLNASGTAVGLAAGQMGNSEVGHLNIGAGRIVYQDTTLIHSSIQKGDFFHKAPFLAAIQRAKEQKRSLHVLILLSPGGVHSDEQHLFAFLELCQQQQFQQVYIHAFLDGRDTPPKSASASLKKLETVLEQTKAGCIASITGRYYAMDRDKRMERTELAYDAIVHRKALHIAPDPLTALNEAYERGETDEFVKPTLIGTSVSTLGSHDPVVFLNFRADRARQLTKMLCDKNPHILMVTLTEYYPEQTALIAYPRTPLKNVLGEVLQDLGLKQLRLAETEKYAHVTFFFNGGQEQAFGGEERLLIPSPKVTTYDLQPEMSAPELTDRLVQSILKQEYDVIICNFANADMVGHTGLFPPTVLAIECLDRCLKAVLAAVETIQGELLITADHGNAELMYDETTGQPHTAHTLEPVPLIYAGPKKIRFQSGGILADIAPTMLTLMQKPIPKEMTGNNLVRYVL